MSELQQPGPSDAVKGGQFSPTYGAVLGGLEGAKRRLANSSDQVRIAALFEVLKYGREGLELVVQIVKTETGAVQRAAYELLWERTSERARIKLQLLKVNRHIITLLAHGFPCVNQEQSVCGVGNPHPTSKLC
jgi:hypothetical protein